jgi:transposase
VLRAKLAEIVHENPHLAIPQAAEQLGMSQRWVRKWRKRWTQEGFSLEDRPRSGRPPTFSPEAGHGDQGGSLRAACSA